MSPHDRATPLAFRFELVIALVATEVAAQPVSAAVSEVCHQEGQTVQNTVLIVIFSGGHWSNLLCMYFTKKLFNSLIKFLHFEWFI